MLQVSFRNGNWLRWGVSSTSTSSLVNMDVSSQWLTSAGNSATDDFLNQMEQVVDQTLSLIDRFRHYIRDAASVRPLSSPTLKNNLTLERDRGIEVIYAPFEHITHDARVVIVGITPGLVQAENAIIAARSAIRNGMSDADALRHAKLTASFSGRQTRYSLVSMMDAIGLQQLLGVPSTDVLFSTAGEKVHFTSALRYPVFVDGKNYNGSPDMIRTPILRRMVESYLAEEVKTLPHAMWIPLGPKPAAALRHLAALGVLERQRILDGLPHPSGANAERIACFLGRKPAHAASLRTNPQKLAEARRALEAQVQRLIMKGASA